jgi:hypothetical protein
MGILTNSCPPASEPRSVRDWMAKPEEKAREQIDQQLKAAGWVVPDLKAKVASIVAEASRLCFPRTQKRDASATFTLCISIDPQGTTICNQLT